MRIAPKPYIYSRAQWGANEKIREQSPPSYGTVKTGFIHHTVNANNYTAAQVPALIRGIYAYHVESRGWRDIGYNYLVDRFGRIWEGRWGGVDKAVVGAHTLGYNEVSFAMSAIGNYDIANPPQAVLTAYARLFAWKLSLYNIRADGSHVWVKNRWLHAINGHRDVGQTACPGRYLYAKIPYIRTLAQSYQNAAQSVGLGDHAALEGDRRLPLGPRWAHGRRVLRGGWPRAPVPEGSHLREERRRGARAVREGAQGLHTTWRRALAARLPPNGAGPVQAGHPGPLREGGAQGVSVRASKGHLLAQVDSCRYTTRPVNLG